MKSASQQLPALVLPLDRERSAANAARLIGVVDLSMRASALTFWSLDAGWLAINALLPIIGAIIVWRLLRDPVFAGFTLLATMAAAASVAGPLGGLLGGVVFWTSLFFALRAD